MKPARSSWSIDSSTSISRDALLGGAVERVLDRLAELLDELGVAVEERARRGRAPRAGRRTSRLPRRRWRR